MYTTIKRIFDHLQFTSNESEVLFPEDLLLQLGGVTKLLNVSRDERGIIEEDLIDHLSSHTRSVPATYHNVTVGGGVLGSFWAEFLKFMEAKYRESSKVTA